MFVNFVMLDIDIETDVDDLITEKRNSRERIDDSVKLSRDEEGAVRIL